MDETDTEKEIQLRELEDVYRRIDIVQRNSVHGLLLLIALIMFGQITVATAVKTALAGVVVIIPIFLYMKGKEGDIKDGLRGRE